MANRNFKIKNGNIEVCDEIDVEINPNLKEISKILKTKALKGLDFKMGSGRISFSADVNWDPKRKKDWRLIVLAVPDLNEQGHEHYLFNLREMRKIRKYIDSLIGKIEGME